MSNNHINGPINVVRMEGDVFGIKKVIYLFMDVHMPINSQTECGPSSLDITQFLDINLKNLKKTIDFMYEIRVSDYEYFNTLDYKSIYLNQVGKFFINNKQGTDNIRYHYADIRDYYFNVIYFINKETSNILHNLRSTSILNPYTIKDLFKYLDDIINELLFWDKVLFSKTDQKKKNNLKRTEQNLDKIVNNYIYKITEKYKHPEIKSKIQPIFDNIKISLNKSIDALNQIKVDFNNVKNDMVYDDVLNYAEYTNSYYYGQDFHKNDKFLTKIVLEYDVINHNIMILFARLMDIYFLRRFLDKDYITTCLVYTGAAHSINYIQHLLTNYDFKITHLSYSRTKDINKLNDMLKNITNIKDTDKYEYELYPPILKQCSDLTNFPKNFD